MSWQEFPKLELHLHLEGAAPPALVRDLAKRRHIDISRAFNQAGGYAFHDFAHFLQVYEAATSVLKTPEDYAALTQAVLDTLDEQGVVYAETFISPDFCGGCDLAAWREYVAAMAEVCQHRAARGGPDLRAIVTCIRHFGPDAAKETALCAAETMGAFVRGFGMGGNETIGRQGDFAWAFDCAREAGLGLTTHAGEFGGPASVREAVEKLGVRRLGHGVRAIEDPALVDLLAEREIFLEICPGSNLRLGLYPNLRAHPVERLRAAGVKFSISTDDPPFFGTTMVQEYQALEQIFDWDAGLFGEINAMALAAAFCDGHTKANLTKRLKQADALAGDG